MLHFYISWIHLVYSLKHKKVWSVQFVVTYHYALLMLHVEERPFKVWNGMCGIHKEFQQRCLSKKVTFTWPSWKCLYFYKSKATCIAVQDTSRRHELRHPSLIFCSSQKCFLRVYLSTIPKIHLTVRNICHTQFKKLLHTHEAWFKVFTQINSETYLVLH